MPSQLEISYIYVGRIIDPGQSRFQKILVNYKKKVQLIVQSVVCLMGCLFNCLFVDLQFVYLPRKLLVKCIVPETIMVMAPTERVNKKNSVENGAQVVIVVNICLWEWWVGVSNFFSGICQFSLREGTRKSKKNKS